MTNSTPAFKIYDFAALRALNNVLRNNPQLAKSIRDLIKQDNEAVSPTSPQASTDDTDTQAKVNVINDNYRPRK